MNSEPALDTEKLQIKRFIHENGGRNAQVLFVPNTTHEIRAKYFDRSSRRCEISINRVQEVNDLAAAVRNAMLSPTILS